MKVKLICNAIGRRSWCKNCPHSQPHYQMKEEIDSDYDDETDEEFFIYEPCTVVGGCDEGEDPRCVRVRGKKK